MEKWSIKKENLIVVILGHGSATLVPCGLRYLN
jgi:hypothetical protein